jgi:hypothetical protein
MSGQTKQMHITMSAHLTARLVSKNLEEAIANYEVFVPTARNKDVIERVNSGGVHPGFNVISASLHHVVLICVCRIWDNDRKVASIWSLKRKLESSGLITELAKRDAGIDTARIAAWSKAVVAVGESDELRAVQATRNLWLAHTAAPDRLYQGNARQEVYGDERKVIESTVPLVEEANALIGYTFFPFPELRRRWKGEATRFWASCAL